MDDLCAELKQRREARGLSIDDLFEKTRINPDLLVALEEGRFDVLPDTYVRLFLRKYAQEVGADPNDVIKAYDLYALRQRREAGPEPSEPAPASVPTGSASAGAGKGIVIAAAGIVAVIIAAVLLQGGQPTPEPAMQERALPQTNAEPRVPRQNTPAPVIQTDPGPTIRTPPSPVSPPPATETTETTEPTETTSPTASTVPNTTSQSPSPVKPSPPEPALETAPEPASSPAQEPAETAPTAPEAPAPQQDRVVNAFSLSPERIFAPGDTQISLTIRGLDNTVATVAADDELLYQGPILAGRRTTWTARERFRVDVRTGSAVQIALQGRPIRPLGRSGEQVRLFISRSSIWVEEIEPASRAAATQ